MRRGFSVVEVLVVVAVLCMLAAISYPVFQGVKRAANQSFCASNLRQIGQALAIYRANYESVASGTPVEMGLPPTIAVLGADSGIFSLKCRGNNPEGNFYADFFPGPDHGVELRDAWSRYVRRMGEQSIVMVDANHQSRFPRSRTWDRWFALGLRLDGGVAYRKRVGYPVSYRWWH